MMMQRYQNILEVILLYIFCLNRFQDLTKFRSDYCKNKYQTKMSITLFLNN